MAHLLRHSTCMLTIKKIIFLTSSLFFLSVSQALAAPTVQINIPSTSVIAGDEFKIEMTAQEVQPNGIYYAKALGGSEFYDVQTLYNSSWLSWNSSWSDMPTITPTTATGSATLTARFKPDLPGGTYNVKVRIRSSDSDTNYDSDLISMQVSTRPTPQPTATPSPTPTDTPKPSPTPTKSPTPKPTPKKTPSPTAEPVEEPEAEVLGLAAQQTPDLMPTTTPRIASDQESKPIVLTAFLFIIPGVALTTFGAYSFLKRHKSEYNDMSEKSILRPQN